MGYISKKVAAYGQFVLVCICVPYKCSWPLSDLKDITHKLNDQTTLFCSLNDTKS